MVLDSSFATSFNNRAGIPSWLSSSFSWLHFEQFSLYKTGGHFWTKSCLTLGVKTCGREQRLKWLRKALAIEVKKPLKLEAGRPSLLEGHRFDFFRNDFRQSLSHRLWVLFIRQLIRTDPASHYTHHIRFFFINNRKFIYPLKVLAFFFSSAWQVRSVGKDRDLLLMSWQFWV